MTRLYIDSETCGLHGMPVLLQYAVENCPINLYDIWKRPVGETLDLIEWMLTHTIVGFNLAFDHFMLQNLHHLPTLPEGLDSRRTHRRNSSPGTRGTGWPLSEAGGGS